MQDALRARIDAFLKEFTFVGRYIDRSKRIQTRPTVKRVDLDLLDQIGFTDHWLPWPEMTSVLFVALCADGTEITRMRQSDKSRPVFSLRHPWTWVRHEMQGETVYEGISRLRDLDQDRIAFILEIKDHWGYEIIVHKVPAGYQFSEWIARIREIATDELRGEIAKVDTVAS